MHTKKLEVFATKARTDLIAEVSARLDGVLAPGSSARIESPNAVKALEAEIVRKGGGAIGRKHVAEQQAYEWFNRIIAFRFMDANHYTTTAVVSPSDSGGTQPAVLSAAKRGEFDPEVFASASVRDHVTNLLNGTIASHDRDGEAYGLILAAYCSAWNKAMPFMFRPAGNYTELLMPANLLAADSVLARAVETLTADDCSDVEVIGWLYQFYIAERKDEVFAGFKKNKKAGPDEIPAATQLFTPDWIVRYLVQNSIGRLWMLSHPDSTLINQMEYFIAPDGDPGESLKITSPETLTVMDPACGSGHMLTYAFDLLYDIYEEEGYAPSEIPAAILTNNLYGLEIDPRASELAAFALAMKARAKDRRWFRRGAVPEEPTESASRRAAHPVQPNIRVIEPIRFTPDELRSLSAAVGVVSKGRDPDMDHFWNQFEHADLFGSLIQPDAEALAEAKAWLVGPVETTQAAGGAVVDLLTDSYLDRAQRVIDQADLLARKYTVVIANPPYMGSKNMVPALSDFAKATYPDGKQDLYGCFVLRFMDLAQPGGCVATIIGDTWMSIVSFEALRRDLLSGHSFDSFVHLRDVSNHPDIFGANAAFILSMSGGSGRRGTFVRLTALNDEEKRQALLRAISDPDVEWRHTASSRDFEQIPGSPIVYWLSEKMRAAFTKGRPLSDLGEMPYGMKTGRNERFLRRWWEISRKDFETSATSRTTASESGRTWFPCNKGGEFRKWYGNLEYAVNFANDGEALYSVGNASVDSTNHYQPAVSWTRISSGSPAFRLYPAGTIADMTGSALFSAMAIDQSRIASVLNSEFVRQLLSAIAPTLDFQPGQVAKLPISADTTTSANTILRVTALVSTARSDWNSCETSWDFTGNALVVAISGTT